MSIRIISLGRIKQEFVLEGEREYIKRLRAPYTVSIQELEIKKSGALSESEVKKREGELLLGALKKQEQLIILDERGEEFTSKSFAKFLQQRLGAGSGTVVFAIGGAYGWDAAVRERAVREVSLSRLTFPYQMTRLILIEQLYRAATIIQGAPYHK